VGYKIDNVIALYTDGVANGLVVQAADKYLAQRFVDHTTPDIDGRSRYIEAYEPLVSRFTDRLVRPMRGFEDQSKVFLHSYQGFGRGQISRVSVDVFDTNKHDLITARWNVTVPIVPTRSGRSQIDGPTYVTDLARTDDNKATVARFVDAVLIGGHWCRLEQYLDVRYAEHSPAIPDGLRGLRHHLEHHAAAGTPIRYGEVKVLVGCGDFVVTFSSSALGESPYHVFDIYRLSGGRIVEHWDAATKVAFEEHYHAPRERWPAW